MDKFYMTVRKLLQNKFDCKTPLWIGVFLVSGVMQLYSQAHPFCDSLFIKHTYNWSRLNLKDSCVTMTGTVKLLIPPSSTQDGDTHIYILPDSGYDTSVDPFCNGWTNPLYLPNVGEHVRVTGPWVLDPSHGWNEIHPVSGMEIVGATTGIDEGHTFLNNFKLMPQPADGQITFLFAVAPHAITSINIYNMLGRHVGDYQLAETHELTMNASYWPAGNYVYSISQGNEILKNGKFQIVH
jgi:hypothetical protein